MNREQTNRIRYVLEEILPPALRDTKMYLFLAKRVWGEHITRLAEFRQNAPFLTPEEYETLYRDHPRVHDETDNSQGCIDKITQDIVGDTVCDVGCGTGALLLRVAEKRNDIKEMTGVDFVIEDAKALDRVNYVAARIEDLPFEDNAFDTVICTHVIEHILEYRVALAELRRIAKKRLIIVVPREREALYTFNPHFNFFPYKHALLRALHPIPENYECIDIGRDIYYREDY
ncbi:class I SAM-dependent methyltransferase [Parasulfitobacter algicola]|uniref:Methyltransferase domain-containing protein n=1 Tax=Parasulfitobacter algicola TaxID=2614809 RepID=A0ABX2IR28_9RHOB|nr:methyltransferase domain-containing protein [Sulfitobacter algicola]NSX55351.1 methyltransferase domain-containing protein [Sulfitobacter algicola]